MSQVRNDTSSYPWVHWTAQGSAYCLWWSRPEVTDDGLTMKVLMAGISFYGVYVVWSHSMSLELMFMCAGLGTQHCFCTMTYQGEGSMLHWLCRGNGYREGKWNWQLCMVQKRVNLLIKLEQDCVHTTLTKWEPMLLPWDQYKVPHYFMQENYCTSNS
jgi:hypothetical protein